MAGNDSNDNSSDFELYRYDPSLVAAVIFVVLFALVSFLHTYQLLRTRTWYFIPFCIGGYFEFIGYIGRVIGSQETPDWTVGAFVQQSVLILVAPALFAASIYMELGRIIRVTDGAVHSIIKPRWLTKIFVGGDIASFLLQGSGGGVMAAANDLSGMTTGENIIIGGLVIQIIFFSFFVIVSVTFHARMLKCPTSKALHLQNGTLANGGGGTLGSAWTKHLNALYAGSALVLIRSVFRLVEYAQGNDGYLISHEVFLYLFDAVLMFALMVVFAVVHPSQVNALLKGGKALAVKKVVSVYRMEEL